MIYYATITAMCFAQYLLIRRLPDIASKMTGFILISLFAAFAGLRGMVGTDTWMYTHIVGAIGDGAQVPLEPGFIYLARFFTSLTDDTTLAVNSFSILFFIFAATYLIRATRTEAIYLFAFFAPQYFIMYSFNGLRIGLASMAFILALQFWQREKRIAFFALLALAVSLQYTIVLAIGVFFLFIKPMRQTKAVLLRILTLCFCSAIVITLNQYIGDQFASYATFERFDPLAGLSYFIKVTLLMACIWWLPIPRAEIREKFLISIAILVVGLLITSQSYAGLRIMDIMMWLIPLLFIYSLNYTENAGNRFYSGLLVVGFVGSLGVIRNIASSNAEIATSFSPFQPYHFMWEIGF